LVNWNGSHINTNRLGFTWIAEGSHWSVPMYYHRVIGCGGALWLRCGGDGEINSIVFALANPVPEVDPAEATRYAAVVATGRSDFPNQINNVLAFPGVFRGLLDAHCAQSHVEYAAGCCPGAQPGSSPTTS
jgi:hypothetical protein